MLNAFVILKVG